MFLNIIRLLPINQSAFSCLLSVETALTRVTSDLLQFMDADKVSIVASLDISAAFDTVDHNILLRRLSLTFGIKGAALDWLGNYMLNRSQRVIIGETYSDPFVLENGVPQGSILGPLLFILYTIDVFGIIEKFGLNPHSYADDTIIYGATKFNFFPDLLNQIYKCIFDLNNWHKSNGMILNSQKTNFIAICSKNNSLKINIPLNFKDTIKILGLLIDQQLTFESHVSTISKTCLSQLKQIRSLNIAKSHQKILINSLIFCRLDFCNGLLYNCKKPLIGSLQRVQNAAARLVLAIPKFTPVREEMIRTLHWLPVEQRIQFKLCYIVHKCLYSNAPEYLRHLCTPVERICERDRRTAASSSLFIPRHRLVGAGGRAFQIVGPTLWNKLTIELKNQKNDEKFKIDLKTYLMRIVT